MSEKTKDTFLIGGAAALMVAVAFREAIASTGLHVIAYVLTTLARGAG